MNIRKLFFNGFIFAQSFLSQLIYFRKVFCLNFHDLDYLMPSQSVIHPCKIHPCLRFTNPGYKCDPNVFYILLIKAALGIYRNRRGHLGSP